MGTDPEQQLIPPLFRRLFGEYHVADKHAVDGFFESLGREVRPFGSQVAVIEPWATRTSA